MALEIRSKRHNESRSNDPVATNMPTKLLNAIDWVGVVKQFLIYILVCSFYVSGVWWRLYQPHMWVSVLLGIVTGVVCSVCFDIHVLKQGQSHATGK